MLRSRLKSKGTYDVVLGGLELPESNVDGDTTLTLGLELVKNPRILEGTLSELSSLLLELLDGTLVNSTALVNQVCVERCLVSECSHCDRDQSQGGGGGVTYDRWWWTCRSRRVR